MQVPPTIVYNLRHPWKACQIAAAKARHRRLHPECALTGLSPRFFLGRSNDVHHIVPVHVAPDRACDPDNLITLCRAAHLLVAHPLGYASWNENLMEDLKTMRAWYVSAVLGSARTLKKGVRP